jgi:hypothetical protein
MRRNQDVSENIFKTPEEVEASWNDGLHALDELRGLANGSRLCWCRIGKGLLAGRLKCPGNKDFSQWLDGTGYRTVSRHSRQDSMWLFLNQDLVLPQLSNTTKSAPYKIREFIRTELPEIYAKCSEVSEIIKEMMREKDQQNQEVNEESSSAALSATGVADNSDEIEDEDEGELITGPDDRPQTEEEKNRVTDKLLLAGKTYRQINKYGIGNKKINERRRVLQNKGKLPKGRKARARKPQEEPVSRGSRGGSQMVLPAVKLRSFTREEVDPHFEQELREKLGREPTDAERNWAWVNKHGQVNTRNHQELEEDRVNKTITEWVGTIQDMARLIAKPLESLRQQAKDPRLLETLNKLSMTSVGRIKLRRIRHSLFYLNEAANLVATTPHLLDVGSEEDEKPKLVVIN